MHWRLPLIWWNAIIYYYIRINRIHGLKKNVYEVLRLKVFARNSSCSSKSYDGNM